MTAATLNGLPVYVYRADVRVPGERGVVPFVHVVHACGRYGGLRHPATSTRWGPGLRLSDRFLTPPAIIDSASYRIPRFAAIAAVLAVGTQCAARDPGRLSGDGIEPARAETTALAATSSANALADAPVAQADQRERPERSLRQLWNSMSPFEAWAAYNEWRGDPYQLDDVPRRLQPGETLQCARDELVLYRGSGLVFAGPVQVHPAFVARLERFEQLVNEVAVEVYGRKPTKLHHMGAFSCRKSRNRSARISEHAFGNAIDINAIEFGPASKEQRSELPAYLRWGFTASVRQHWNASRSESGRAHRRFLRLLAERAVEEEVFRVALGPSHRGHADHFHFDMSPWNYVNL